MSASHPEMTWYYRRDDGHTRVKVFMNGAKCGGLCFRHEEFNACLIWHNMAGFIKFVDEGINERLSAQQQPRKDE